MTFPLTPMQLLYYLNIFQFDDMELSKIDGWPLISLLGTDDRLNFTFQLGPPGGRRGYQVFFCF